MNAYTTSSAIPNERPGLMGLAELMTMVFRGEDLNALHVRLVERATLNPDDADALMDLAVVLQLHNQREIGLAVQAEALQIKRLYHLPATRGEQPLRLLALMAPGDISANMPLEFLIRDSDIALDMLYLLPGEPLPETVPDHDVLIVAVGESDHNRQLLHQLSLAIDGWPRPVLNLPQHILQLSRDAACAMLADAPGILMPVSRRVDRTTLEELARGAIALHDLLPDASFPIIARPVDSHAGRGLAKIETPENIAAYLDRMTEPEFYISRFVDYRSADGLFRKYRVVLIDGKPYAGHMAISSHWMIHYLNAAMLDNAANRAEEERFMTGFDEAFARRNVAALQAIAERSALDYLIIDCAETRDGALLVFEIDSSAVVHAMDPVDIFPYTQPQMRTVFAAFHELLARAAAKPLPRSDGAVMHDPLQATHQ